MADKNLQTYWFARNPFVGALAVLGATLCLLFLRSLVPGLTVFSNDGPLGTLIAADHRMPDKFTAGWQDLNSIGGYEGVASPSVTYGLQWLLGPVGFSKFYAPFCLLMLGLGAWTFFRQLGFAQPACILGGLAAM